MSDHMEAPSDKQRRSFEDRYRGATDDLRELHTTEDPLLRFLQDRRLNIGFEQFLALSGLEPAAVSLLVVCA